MSTKGSPSNGMDKELEGFLKRLLEDKGEELEKTLEGLTECDVSLGNLNKIWKKRVKQKDCGKEEYLAVERIIEKFLEREKNFGEAHHKLGNIYYRRKFYEDAERKYREALDIKEWFLCSIEANPFESLLKQDSRLGSTISEGLKDEFETKCVPISETATITEGKEGRWKLTDGEKIYNLKKEDRWINIYQEDTQDKAWCYHDLGYLLYQTWNYKDAVVNYNEAIEIAEKAKDEKSIAWFYKDLGTARMKLELYDNAEEDFRKALDPSYMFSINENLEKDLNKNKISGRLRSKFKNNSPPLSNEEFVIKKENGWVIKDGTTEKFIVKKESGKLNVYNKEKEDKGKKKGDKDKAYVYNALGRLYYRKKLYEEARKKLELAKEHNPDLDKVYNNIGLLDFEKGSYENAKLCFQKAIEMDKSEKKFLFTLKEKDAKKKMCTLQDKEQKLEGYLNDEDKVKELQKKLRCNCWPLLSYKAKKPSRIDKKHWVIEDGEDRYWIEKIDKSLKVYKDLLKDGPIEPELNYILEKKEVPLPAEPIVNKENGKWVITDKKRKEIYCIVRKEDGKLNLYAKKKCENHAEAHLNLGNVFFKEENFKEADKEYEEAIRIDRNSAEAYYNLGYLAAKNKEKERAEKLYGEALRINPDYTKARTALEALDLPEETGVDWWDWWFSGSGQQSGSKKGEKIHWLKRPFCRICGQEPRQEIPRQKIPGRKLVGGALIIILFFVIGFITLMPLVGTLMPPGNVTYEHKNDTTFSYQKITIENSFSVDAKFENDLNNQSISKELENIFKTKGFPISESKNATVTEEKDNKWVIADGEKIYIVEKVDGKLIVYTGSIDEIKKEITETFSNTTTPRTGTIPSYSILTLIGLAVFIFFILIFPQLKKGTVSIGEFKFEVETKDAGTSDIAK